MPTNDAFERRAAKLARAELEALQVLKTHGWIILTDAEVTDGTPEIGNGSPTFRFEARHPLVILKNKTNFANQTAPEFAEPKKRGRPKKLQ